MVLSVKNASKYLVMTFWALKKVKKEPISVADNWQMPGIDKKSTHAAGSVPKVTHQRNVDSKWSILACSQNFLVWRWTKGFVRWFFFPARSTAPSFKDAVASVLRNSRRHQKPVFGYCAVKKGCISFRTKLVKVIIKPSLSWMDDCMQKRQKGAHWGIKT